MDAKSGLVTEMGWSGSKLNVWLVWSSHLSLGCLRLVWLAGLLAKSGVWLAGLLPSGVWLAGLLLSGVWLAGLLPSGVGCWYWLAEGAKQDPSLALVLVDSQS